jgi:hypothetical protein
MVDHDYEFVEHSGQGIVTNYDQWLADVRYRIEETRRYAIHKPLNSTPTTVRVQIEPDLRGQLWRITGDLGTSFAGKYF